MYPLAFPELADIRLTLIRFATFAMFAAKLWLQLCWPVRNCSPHLPHLHCVLMCVLRVACAVFLPVFALCFSAIYFYRMRYCYYT